MKTSLGIWALGRWSRASSMATSRRTRGRPPWSVRRAVDGLGDLMDVLAIPRVRRSCPRTISTRCEVRSTGTASTALRPAFISTRQFGRGGLCSPDSAIRAEAQRRTVAAADFAGELGAYFIIWPGIEGLQLPASDAICRQSAGPGCSRNRPRRREMSASTECSCSSSTRTPSRR